MNFVNKWFLIGLAAALLPVLIHLLTRDRVRKVAFSTLRFFARTSARILRRKRFQEAILLAMRMLVAGLVAFAFARPYLKAKSAEEARTTIARTARVIVADVSLSMSRSSSPDAMKDFLRKEAKAALADLSEGTDAAGLVTFADAPSIDVAMVNEFAPIRNRIDSMQIGHGGTNIVEALRTADGMLKKMKASTREIVLISDLQRVGWKALRADWKLPADTKLTIKRVALPEQGGLAITDANYPESMVLDGLPRQVAVKVVNYSKAEVKDLPVSLTIGAKAPEVKKINIGANSSLPVRFTHVFDSAGDNPGVIHVGADDKTTPENTIYFNARVIPRIPVVILNGAPSTVAAADAAFFLDKALAPTKESPFAVKVVVAATARPQDIKDALVVVLSNVGQVPESVADALKDLLQRGGGVLFMPGDRVSPKEFDQLFANPAKGREIAPCRLRKSVTAEKSEPSPGPAMAAGPSELAAVSIAKIDLEHPAFEVFQRPHYGDFTTPKFYQWWEVMDSQLARVLARFDDGPGRPAILERQIGRGISMMLTSSTDLRWSDLPLRAIFLPYLHQTVRYLAIRSEKKTAYPVGTAIVVPAGCKLKDAAGKTHQEESVLASEPGFYTLTGGEGGDFCYAVNTDPAELDVAAMTPEEVVAAVQRAPNEAGGGDAGEDVADRAEQDRHGLWWYAMAAVAALFAMELFLANRTLRH
ncbi:MAG: BatA domain-containing protein [Phycisphaerae bacterium]